MTVAPPRASAAAPTLTAPRRGPRASRLVSPALAVLSGALLFLATPPIGLWPLAPLGVTSLALSLRSAGLRRAYLLALLTGLAYLVPLLSWARAPGIDLWLLLAAFEALLFALVGPALVLVRRLPLAPLWGSAVVVAGEALRDTWPFGGFAWARLAFTQPGSSYTRWAAVGGAPLVSFAVALTGLVLAEALCRQGFRRRTPLGLGAAAIGALGLVVPLPSAGAPTLAVAVVQGNVPRQGFDVFRQRQAVLADHVQQTLTLAAEVRAGRAARPQLVVWPEDADDVDPFHDRLAYDEITAASAAIDAPILLGSVLDTSRPGHLENTSLLFTPTGYGDQQYVKRHPVPFGEWLPYRSLIEHLTGRATTLLPEDDDRGSTPGEFTVDGVDVGAVICFEVSDDGIVRDAVSHGAQVLVVQTNNATFGHGGETWQQLAMARLRAVEHGREVVVSSTSGVSAVVDSRGRVLARTGLFEPATLSADLHVSSARTLADRVGPWPDRVITALGLLGIGAGAVAARRRRHTDVIAVSATTERDRP